MVLMSMLSIFLSVGTKSTMRKIVPFFGGTSPTLVLPRSSAQEKSGGLTGVTHISLAGLGERKLVSCTWPSSITTAFPEESILVTTRRTSGGCCAATEPATTSIAPNATHCSFLFIGISRMKVSRGLGPAARLVEHRHRRGDHARHVRKIGRHDHGVVGLGEVAECADVELGDLEVRRLLPAFLAHRGSDHFHRRRGRVGDDAQRGRFALRLVDRRLLLALGGEDRGLLL